MIVLRYADDLVARLHEDESRRFLDALRERFGGFSLSLHPGTTCLIEFGRHAAAERKKRAFGRSETFALGHLHLWKISTGCLPIAAQDPAPGRSCKTSRRSCGKEFISLSRLRNTGSASRHRALRLLFRAHK